MKIDIDLAFAEYSWIETERLILRPVTLKDASDLFAYGSDEITTRFVFERYQNLDEARIGIAKYFMKNPFGKYAIELKATGRMIGTIDLRVDENNNKAELGYILNQDYQGNGYATESATQLLHFAFNILKLNCVFARHDINNPKSATLMQRIGMYYEATLYQDTIHKGKIVDLAYYKILRETFLSSYQKKS